MAASGTASFTTSTCCGAGEKFGVVLNLNSLGLPGWYLLADLATLLLNLDFNPPGGWYFDPVFRCKANGSRTALWHVRFPRNVRTPMIPCARINNRVLSPLPPCLKLYLPCFQTDALPHVEAHVPQSRGCSLPRVAGTYRRPFVVRPWRILATNKKAHISGLG